MANLLCVEAAGLCSVLPRIAQRRGLFHKYGVDVQLTPVSGVGLPELSATHAIAHMGVPAMLMLAARGESLNVLASFDTARLSGCLVVASTIARPENLRGRRLGARLTGAAMWIHTVLALERLGLRPLSGEVEIVEVGGPREIVDALKAGRIDGAFLPRPYVAGLAGHGFSILLDAASVELWGAPDALVVSTRFYQEHPRELEAIIAGMIESAALLLSPHERASAIQLLRSELEFDDDTSAKIALHDLTRSLARKPLPDETRLRATQAVMSRQVPAVRKVRLEQLIDATIVSSLGRSGAIDRVYSAYRCIESCA